MKYNNLIKNIEDKNVIVKYIDEPFFLDEQLKENINEYWKTVDNIFTRGKIFVVKSIEEDEKNVKINICFSDYAHYIYAKRHKVENKNRCNSLWAGIVLETIDNKYLLGEMSEVTASSGEYHISGGSCDEVDLKDDFMDYQKTMFREVKEEFNFNPNEISNLKMKYLKLPSEKESDIGILYKGTVNKSSKEIQEEYDKYLNMLKKTGGEIEFKRLVFVDKNLKNVKEFLKENKYRLMEFTEEMLIYDIEH